MQLSKHAAIRMQQRGRSEQDIALVTTYGTRTPEGYLLRGRDAETQIQTLKKEITRLERLKGWTVITGENDIVVTVYPADHKKQRRMLAR